MTIEHFEVWAEGVFGFVLWFVQSQQQDSNPFGSHFYFLLFYLWLFKGGVSIILDHVT